MALARIVSAHVVALALLAGCSGKVVGTDLTRQPDPTDPTNPSDPSDPTIPKKCTTIAPACDRGDVSFASDQACNGSGAAYCYSRTETCSKLVTWCGHLDAQCDGYPSCDPGDKQVGDPSECFQNPPLTCYSRVACGVSITCAKP